MAMGSNPIRVLGVEYLKRYNFAQVKPTEDVESRNGSETIDTRQVRVETWRPRRSCPVAGATQRGIVEVQRAAPCLSSINDVLEQLAKPIVYERH